MNIRSVQKQKEYFKHKCTESDNDSKIQFDDYEHYDFNDSWFHIIMHARFPKQCWAQLNTNYCIELALKYNNHLFI